MTTPPNQALHRPHGSYAIKWIVDRDGVPWCEAPAPRRWHKHEPQTTAATEKGWRVERCACGATRFSDIPGWIEERKPRVDDRLPWWPRKRKLRYWWTRVV